MNNYLLLSYTVSFSVALVDKRLWHISGERRSMTSHRASGNQSSLSSSHTNTASQSISTAVIFMFLIISQCIHSYYYSTPKLQELWVRDWYNLWWRLAPWGLHWWTGFFWVFQLWRDIFCNNPHRSQILMLSLCLTFDILSDTTEAFKFDNLSLL